MKDKTYMELLKEAISEDRLLELLYEADEDGTIFVDSPTDLNLMIDVCTHHNIDIVKFLNGEIPEEVISMLLVKFSIEENLDEIIENAYKEEIKDKKNAKKGKIIELDKFRH